MTNCEICEKRKEPLMVPYPVYESDMARGERHTKRVWIALVIAILLIFATNAGWIIYESQYERVDYSYDYNQDGEGTNIIGNDNEVINDGPTAPSEN